MPEGDWARPCCEPGGGDAFVFFAVFGSSPTALEISTQRHLEVVWSS